MKKKHQYILYIFWVIFVAVLACNKIEDAQYQKPSEVNALINTSSDNSGNITITPNSNGGISYLINFGDTLNKFYSVLQGYSLNHKYKEGQYVVTIKAYSFDAQVDSITKPITITFNAPQNLVINITKDANLLRNITVSPTADYATAFNVYFGDVANEVPIQINKDSSAKHSYANPGTYKIKVVALSGGSNTLTDSSKSVTITLNQIDLPINFEDPNVYYKTIDFGGDLTVDATDPLNPNNKVKKTTKPSGADTWAGVTIGDTNGLANNLPLTATKTMISVLVYSPAANIPVRLKIENKLNLNQSVETEVLTKSANAWDTLVFDFSKPVSGTPAWSASVPYNKISIFFGFGSAGTGQVFYFDDIKIAANNQVVTTLALPIDFQSSGIDYASKITDFDGGHLTVVANPNSSGINTSTTVAKMIKGPGGQTWGGSYLLVDAPISFTSKIFKMKVYSPRLGAKVLLKFENITTSSINKEVELTTTKVNEWEELSFDFSTIDLSGGKTYQKVVIIIDNGTRGDGTANYTFYLDDIKQN